MPGRDVPCQCVGAKCIWILHSTLSKGKGRAGREALESASRVLSADKPIHSSVTIYIHYEINALSSYTTFRVVNQLAFLLVLPFFLACNFFRSTAQEIPDPRKPNKLCKFIENERHFLSSVYEVVFCSFLLSSFSYLCLRRFALLLFIH